MTLMERYEPVVVADRDDIGSNPTDNRPMMEVIEARLSRRGMLRGALAGLAAAAFGGTLTSRLALAAGSPSTLTFEELEHGIDDTHHVAKGYKAQILIRWGDKVLKDAPEFDVGKQSAAAQEKQFGYNNDFIAFMPLPLGSNSSERGLLDVSHEYTNAELMFPGLTDEDKLDKVTKEQTDIEIAAHGHTIIEIANEGGAWKVVEDSPNNRRITGMTEMRLAGPAAGHELLKTSADPTGTKVLGTLNNCAGGTTPWGTVLIGEENFNGYFGGDAESQPQAREYKRYGISKESWYAWWKFHDRFNVEKEPNEANRFGWIVEIDPYDAASTPVKRTALGRFKHEGATSILNKDGRVVLYSGDDERFDYVYRFVTAGTYNPDDRASNMNLLDEGTLSVGKFHDDGKLIWLPLVHGQGPLTAENGFASQADVVIKARMAADALGATPMDRPEDVETNPVNGRVYVMLTNNSRRKNTQVDAVNPRFNNTAGHIVELIAPGEGAAMDHTADEFTWELFISAGDPVWGGTSYGKGTSKNGWFACPDNCAFDSKGRIWIATDQGSAQAGFGIGDGIWAADTSGDGRAVSRFFFRGPRGAEICGPTFTPDSKTLFVSIQHPAEIEGESTFDTPVNRWPDNVDGMPPRPSVLALTKEDGAELGV
jgi:uncharacterized protein